MDPGNALAWVLRLGDPEVRARVADDERLETDLVDVLGEHLHTQTLGRLVDRRARFAATGTISSWPSKPNNDALLITEATAEAAVTIPTHPLSRVFPQVLPTNPRSR